MNDRLMKELWPAKWISCPGPGQTEYGVCHFRKIFSLETLPARFVIHVSADNRYRLFVNGKSVCFGPARGDPDNWRFETIDIAPYLVPGGNLLAACVWNFGVDRPNAQLTRNTGFILQSDDWDDTRVNSGGNWKVVRNDAYAPAKYAATCVGPGEIVDFAKYPWGWETAGYDDVGWESPVVVGEGRSRFSHSTGWSWALTPRTIPFMEEIPVHFESIRRTSGIDAIRDPSGFLQARSELRIPALTKASLLLDQARETTAYLEMTVSGGKGSIINLTCSEAMYDADGRKRNRDEIDGLTIKGSMDSFLPDGGGSRKLSTLWWRTYRYVQLDIETRDESLVIHSLHGISTGYPFKENAVFECEDPTIGKIWDVGWRTARLCGHETYMDCPYFEQLQYVGDTRIQCLISLYVSGDDRLFRNAIELIDSSRNSEGITLSNYPLCGRQIIPPFSLYWVCMVHDYWMHRDDDDFTVRWLNGISQVLAWYEDKIDSRTGMLGPVPYWNFVDWTKEWPWDNGKHIGGVPEGADEGGSSINTLHLAYTLEKAAELFRYFGKKEEAGNLKKLSAGLKKSTLRLCWDKNRRLLADTPEKTGFSQHANINAVLAGLFSPPAAKAVMEKVIADESLVQCSLYFKFYLFQAMKKAGLGHLYLCMLGPWHDMINNGLTTFAEVPDLAGTRSDCHAWSASPNYDLLATVLGITPSAPGFREVRIEPRLADLKSVRGEVPHPLGSIKVEFKNEKNGLVGKVVLPKGLTGVFVQAGKSRRLLIGENLI